MKSLIFAITFLAVAVALAAVPASAQSAADVTASFYDKLASLNVRGLPDERQLSALARYLSADIVAKIKSDRRKQAQFIKRHPNEKPPWIEGDLFSSLFEGPTSHVVGRSRTLAGYTHVDVKLSNSSGGDKSDWTDTAVLRKAGGEWRIADILYKGKWQFKNGSSLKNVLK